MNTHTKVREVTSLDIRSLLKNKYDFPIPKLDLCPIRAAVEDSNSNLIGVGMIKPVGEITIIIDPTKSNIMKAAAIKSLFDEAIYQSTKYGIHQWYAFIDSNEWALSIRKHYHFDPVNRKCYTLEL